MEVTAMTRTLWDALCWINHWAIEYRLHWVRDVSMN